MKTLNIETPQLRFLQSISQPISGGMYHEISFLDIMDRYDYFEFNNYAESLMYLYGTWDKKSIIVINKIAFKITNDGDLKVVSGINIPNSVLYKTPIQVEIRRIYDREYGPMCMYDVKTLEPLLFYTRNNIMDRNTFFEKTNAPYFNKVNEV